MKTSWRPLGILLLVVALLWFISGPLRTTGSADTGTPRWGGASPPPTLSPGASPTRTPVPTATRDATSGTGSQARDTTDSDGGLFDVVDRARKRLEDARGDAPRESVVGASAAGSHERASTPPATRSSPAPAQNAERTQAAGADAPADKLMLVLDASGSMARRDDAGRTSMQNAQKAMSSALESVPSGTPVGLRVFGSRVDGHGKPTPQACRDTRLVRPLEPLDHKRMSTAIHSFAPLGETPIARSLDAAVDDLGTGGKRAILLVTDGEESCDPDPCRAVADARAAGVDVRVGIVGLRVDDRARNQLRCIADTSNGFYTEAGSDRDLGSALQTALDRLRDETEPRRDAGANSSAVRANTQTASANSSGFSLGTESAAAAILFLLLLAFVTRKR